MPVYPSEANMTIIDISGTGVDPVDLSNYMLKEKNIFIREGNYTSKLYGDRYVRISYSIPTEEVMEFRKEFKNSIEAVQKQKGIKVQQ